MNYVTIIGTRNPTENQKKQCKYIIKTILKNGYGIITGGAKGIDQIAMQEVNKVNPELLCVVLPWENYERDNIVQGNKIIVYNPSKHKEWTKSVYKYHPKPEYLTKGTIRLHARNYGIVINSVEVIAFPNTTRKGGTEQGIRIAQALGKPLKIYV